MSGINVFDATRRLDEGLIDLLDLVKLMAAGVWQLRIDVAGFIAQMPNATVQQLDSRFALGSGLEFRNFPAVLDEPWPTQRLRIACVGLTSAVGLYEGWVGDISGLFPAAARKPLSKRLQLPPAAASLWPSEAGIDDAMAIMATTPPTFPAAMAAIQNEARKSRTYSLAHIGDLAIAYRAFKELRNCIAHNGRLVDHDAQEWCRLASAIPMTNLGLRLRPLDLTANLEGQQVAVTVQDIAALVTIINRMAATVDAEAANSLEGQREVLRQFPGSRARPHLVQCKQIHYGRHLANVLKFSGIIGPRGTEMADVVSMLMSEGLAKPG